MNKRITVLVPDALPFQPKRLSIMLTVVALTFWAVSVTQAKLVLDDWGIIHSLPVTYLFGVGFLTIAAAILWLSKESHNFLMGFQLFFFIAMLWATPLLLGTTLPFTRYGYGYFTNTQYIINYGHLNIVTQWLHSWPGFSIFQTALVEIPGIKNTDAMLLWSPLIIQFLMVIPFFLFSKNIINRSNYCWAAVWVFYLFDHTNLLYFSNQVMALFFFWLIITILIKSARGLEPLSNAYEILLMILAAGLILTHLLTSIACLFVLVSLLLSRKLRNLNIVLLFTIFTLAWFIFVATGYFQYMFSQIGSQILRINLLWKMEIAPSQNVGSFGQIMTVNITILLSVLMCVIALVGLIISRKNKNINDNTVLFMVVGVSFLLFLAVSIYSGSMIERVYVFILPLLAYFGVKMLSKKVTAVIFVALLVIVIPISVVAIFANQNEETITLSQIGYWHFVEEKTTEGYFTGGGMSPTWSLGFISVPDSHVYIQGVTQYSLNAANLWMNALTTNQWPQAGENAYVTLSSFEKVIYQEGFNQNQFVPNLRSWLNDSTNYNLIFNSGDVTAYMHEVTWVNSCSMFFEK
jgi:hypothetical protein